MPDAMNKQPPHVLVLWNQTDEDVYEKFREQVLCPLILFDGDSGRPVRIPFHSDEQGRGEVAAPPVTSDLKTKAKTPHGLLAAACARSQPQQDSRQPINDDIGACRLGLGEPGLGAIRAFFVR